MYKICFPEIFYQRLYLMTAKNLVNGRDIYTKRDDHRSVLTHFACICPPNSAFRINTQYTFPYQILSWQLEKYVVVYFGSSYHQCRGPDTVSSIFAASDERSRNADKQDRRLRIPLRKFAPLRELPDFFFHEGKGIPDRKDAYEYHMID